MMKYFLSLLLAASAFYTSHAISDMTNTAAPSFNKRALTMSTREALADDKALSKTISLLKKHPIGASISQVVENARTTNRDDSALSTLQTMGTNHCFEAFGNLSAQFCAHNHNIEVPELWLFEPQVTQAKAANYSINDVLFAYAPEGDEKSWTYIEAFDRDGNVVILDINSAPTVPVIVVETQGSLAFAHKVERLNTMLHSAGLQSSSTFNTPRADSLKKQSSNTVQTTMMNKIYLEDDKEPWIKGAAEIFIITSGVKNTVNGGPDVKTNDPEIRITALHYLDYSKTTYTPNQIVLFWDEHVFNATNIQFWEDDRNNNYKELVVSLLKAIGAVGGLAGLPELTAVANIAEMIINAMPSSFFRDDDDFVDTCYTIMKGETYNNHKCAANNATITLTPFELQRS